MQDFDCNHGTGLGGPFPPEICDDNKHNDRDGAVDMQDADCSPFSGYKGCTKPYIAVDCNPNES